MGEVSKIYYKSCDGGITIINDDFLSTNFIPAGSVDLIIATPPPLYNTVAYDKYLEFTETWLKKALKLTKPDGRACIRIALDYGAENRQTVYADVVAIAKRVGWKYFTTILLRDIQRKNTQEISVDVSEPRITTPVEALVVLYKSVWRKLRDGISDISRQEFIEWTLGLWPRDSSVTARCIKLFSYVKDLVLDPFMGDGTTCILASRLKRRCIGVEANRELLEIAKNRIASETAT